MIASIHPIIEISSWDQRNLTRELPRFFETYGFVLRGKNIAGDKLYQSAGSTFLILKEGLQEELDSATGGQNQRGLHTAVTNIILPFSETTFAKLPIEHDSINFANQREIVFQSPFGSKITCLNTPSIDLNEFESSGLAVEIPESQYLSPDHLSIQVCNQGDAQQINSWLTTIFPEVVWFDTGTIRALRKDFKDPSFPFSLSIQQSPKDFTGLNHLAFRMDPTKGWVHMSDIISRTYRLQGREKDVFKSQKEFQSLCDQFPDLGKLPNILKEGLAECGGAATLFYDDQRREEEKGLTTGLYAQFFTGERIFNGLGFFEFEQTVRLPLEIIRDDRGHLTELRPNYENPEILRTQLFNPIEQQRVLDVLFQNTGR